VVSVLVGDLGAAGFGRAAKAIGVLFAAGAV
jgi:hypothetical protein